MRKPSLALTEILSENIKVLRREKGLSQEALADACGLHRTYVGAVERAERNVTLSSLEVLAAALHVEPAELLQKRKGR